MLVVAATSLDIRFQAISITVDTDLVIAVLKGLVFLLHIDLDVLTHTTTTRMVAVTTIPFLVEFTLGAVATAPSELVRTCNYHQFYFNRPCM